MEVSLFFNKKFLMFYCLVTTFLNPAPGRKDLDRRLLPLTDIICTNQNETEFITGLSLNGLDEFKEAAKTILSYGPKLVKKIKIFLIL